MSGYGSGHSLRLVGDVLFSELGADAATLVLVDDRDPVDFIFSGAVPQGGLLPAIVYYDPYAGGRDLKSIGGRRVWTNTTIAILGVCRGHDDTPALDLADRIDAVLDGRDLETTGAGTVFTIRRTREWTDHPIENGIQYQRRGGWYEFIARRS